MVVFQDFVFNFVSFQGRVLITNGQRRTDEVYIDQAQSNSIYNTSSKKHILIDFSLLGMSGKLMAEIYVD